MGEGTAKDLAFLLYDTAALNSGFDMENPKEFSQRMYRLMQSGLSLENLNLVDEVEIPEEEEEEEVVDLDDNDDSELEEDDEEDGGDDDDKKRRTLNIKLIT